MGKESTKDSSNKENSYNKDVVEPKVIKPIIKNATITFKENRKYDLYVGREGITFRGKETKQVPISWLTHKDFIQVKDYFLVKGV